MKLRRYIITPTSPWGTPMRSDTLYGMLLWTIAEMSGPKACENAIQAFRDHQPPFILSSAMPRDQVRAPMLPPTLRHIFRQWVESGKIKLKTSGDPLLEALGLFKKFRKNSHIPLDIWRENAGSLQLLPLFQWYCEESRKEGESAQNKKATGVKEVFEPHVSIDRATGGALDGALFYSRMRYFDNGEQLHLYTREDEGANLPELLSIVGQMGFGRDASTGKGKFRVELDGAFDSAGLDCANANASMLLSVFAAPDMSGLQGCYKTEIKHAKAGPGTGSPFKNPFLCVQEGSVLRQLPQPPWVLVHIHKNSGIAQIMYPFSLPCRLETEA